MTQNLTSHSDERGITLLEILIAMTLLSFVSLAVFQATSRSFEVNFKLGAESTDTTAILLTLQALESDLAQIYSPVLGIATAKPEDTKTEFWSAPLRPEGHRRTRLKGTAEKITFVANNNRRVEAESPESDFQKITWEVERNASNTYTLYRTTDWDAFRYEEGLVRNKPVRMALLENLSSAKFTYYKKEVKTWEDNWDSEDSYAKEETRFPEMIAFKIEAPDPTNNAMNLQWEIKVKPNMPLNYMDQKSRDALKQKTLE